MQGNTERDAFLESQLELGEVVLARSDRHPLVTDRRILWARRLYSPPRAAGWDYGSLYFSQITRWTLGSRHDGRPLIELEHAPVPRLEHAPAHRLLWFEWGDIEVPALQTTTSLEFARTSSPVFVALRDALMRASIPQGDPFVVRPQGTREERTRTLPLTRTTSMSVVTHRLSRRRNRLYRGQLKWWIRLASWLILAIPAWFIEPWLVLPAIVLAEAAWIVFLQARWRREQQRQTRLR